jgi:YbbR domain-containing protein
MKDFFVKIKENWQLKIIAFFLAVVLWFFLNNVK